LEIDGRAIIVPARWTSLVPADPIIVIGAGRARLRADDLGELASLISRLRPRRARRRG
jgi:hypothetical protein